MNDLRDRFRGCLLAGAVGDALGAAVEFMSLAEIHRKFGPEGARDYAPAYGRLGAITDDTQMTLFTAEGVLRAHVRASERGICDPFAVMRFAYDRWLVAQETRGAALGGTSGWLAGVKGLYSRRAPGNTCLTALQRPATNVARSAAKNDSKGCGGVMRVAPIGLFSDDPFDYASGAAAITHGHPLGYESAGAMAVLVAKALRADSLATATQEALTDIADHAEIAGWVRHAADLAHSDVPADAAIRRLGEGWVAEEALAIGLFCALRAPSLEEALILGVNHSGDSDSTGSIAGQLLGTVTGTAAIPARWLERLELRDVIERIADDLYDRRYAPSGRSPKEWFELYPGG